MWNCDLVCLELADMAFQEEEIARMTGWGTQQWPTPPCLSGKVGQAR